MSVNEIDVNAVNERTVLEKSICLYDIPRESRIKAETRDDNGEKLGDFIIFHHLDGMYSYCTVEGTDKVCHLGATQKLKKVGDYYELA